MTNLEKYCDAFQTVFNVSEQELNDTFTVKDREDWDSMSHLELITALEDAFDIMFDSDDIIAFDSFETGKTLLSKYEIQI